MTWFRCLIEGENFPGSLIQRDGLYGFFATRFVEAASPEAAERLALEALRSDPTLALDSAVKPKDARVYFTEIVEVHGPTTPNSGATWFSMDPVSPKDASR